jgi:acid phosphatase family membrane protein YuiD
MQDLLETKAGALSGSMVAHLRWHAPTTCFIIVGTVVISVDCFQVRRQCGK